MADGGGVALRSPRETELRAARRVRETPPPTCFAGHLLPQGEEGDNAALGMNVDTSKAKGPTAA